MPTTRTTGKVFISHTHQDAELARDLARRLRQAGLEALVARADIPAGSDWKKTLREGIRTADAILLLVTPASLHSDWMMTELGMAEGFERVILPVTVGLKPRDLPAPLQSYHATPFDEVDGAIRKLSEQLATGAND